MAGRRPAPRPKRGGEEFARTHYLEDEGPSSKKPRFDVRNPSALVPDAPEEDAVLEADEIGKRGQQTKRNAVNIDGYESDSSNEGFDARAAVKAKKAEKKGQDGSGSMMEEENDMFADLDERPGDGDEEEDLAAEGKKKKKKKNVRFLEAEEIQGQVSGSKSGGHVSANFSLDGGGTLNGKGTFDKDADSSSESDVGEEERADVMGQVDEEVGAGGKKAHAPKLDAFNMKSEQEEGRFDAEGNFVRKAADPDAVHDSWLEGVSKKDMKKAREAAEKRDEERRQKIIEDDAILTSDVLKALIPHLQRGETVLEALARIGRGIHKKVPKWANPKNKPKPPLSDHTHTHIRTNNDNNNNNNNGTAQPSQDHSTDALRRAAIEALTGAADQLLIRGQTDIYDASRESLTRQYVRETGDEWTDPSRAAATPTDADPAVGSREAGARGRGPPREWQYRWSDARDGGQTHGPYGGVTMVEWSEAGYFGDGVEFREVGRGEEGWSRSVDFV